MITPISNADDQPTDGNKMQQPTVYHLYVRRPNNRRVRLTVTPEPKDRIEVMFGKLLPGTKSQAFILPADPNDIVIPEHEL